MSTNTAFVPDSAPAPISGDEFTPEESAILNGDVPVSTPVPNNTAPEAANDDIDADDVAEIETEDPDQPRDDKGRFVPKSAYLRVKEESKGKDQLSAKLATEIIRLRENLAVRQELLAAAARGQQEQLEPEVMPDPETDLFAYVKWQQKEIERLKSESGQRDNATRQQLEAMQIQTAARVDLESFASKEPAFMEAYGYLVGQRDKELQALGVTNPAQRQATIKAEARELMEGALRNQSSAAERIWALAQARGFQPKPKAQPAINPEAVEQIERINKGKENATSLRGVGTGSDTGQALTLAKIADMDEAQYFKTRDSYVAKHGIGAWKKLTGGM